MRTHPFGQTDELRLSPPLDDSEMVRVQEEHRARTSQGVVGRVRPAHFAAETEHFIEVGLMFEGTRHARKPIFCAVGRHTPFDVGKLIFQGRDALLE
jgi:hypothetical protein